MTEQYSSKKYKLRQREVEAQLDWISEPLEAAESITYPCGDVYEGGVVDGKRQGRGVVRRQDGSEYAGWWRGDAIHGVGRYQSAADGSVYTGEWADNVMQVCYVCGVSGE